MAYNNFRSPYQKTDSWLYSLCIPIVVPVLIFFIDDYFITSAFILPLTLFLLISGLAFRLPASQVAIWAGIYALFVFILLQQNYQMTVTKPYMVPYIRTAGMLAGGIVATFLANHRTLLEKNHEALFEVISALPVAVIVSDISGNILLLNTEAEKILEGHINELAGLSYFSTFIPPEDQGQDIARYVSNFDRDPAEPVAVILKTRTQPPLVLHATLTVVPLDRSRYAVTVVDRPAPAPSPS